MTTQKKSHITLSWRTIFLSDHISKPLNSELGYALPTVLMVSMVIIVLSMGITFSLRSQLNTATEIADRTSAYLKSYSAMNEVIYTVVTSTFTRTGIKIDEEDESTSRQWNLYGESIELSEGVQIRLRDTAGKVSLLFGGRFLQELVANESMNSAESNAIIDSLLDWQDPDDLKRLYGGERFDYQAAGYSYTPRNFYLQTLPEIKLVKGFNEEIFEKIKDDIAYWNPGTYNYFTMSDKLLRVLLKNDSLADRIAQLRAEDSLTPSLFAELTGIRQDAETITFFPSGWLDIEIKAEQGRAVEKINATVVKRQLNQKPFIITEWRR